MLALKYFVLLAFNVAFISFLLAFYDVKISARPAISWLVNELNKVVQMAIVLALTLYLCVRFRLAL